MELQPKVTDVPADFDDLEGWLEEMLYRPERFAFCWGLLRLMRRGKIVRRQVDYPCGAKVAYEVVDAKPGVDLVCPPDFVGIPRLMFGAEMISAALITRNLRFCPVWTDGEKDVILLMTAAQHGCHQDHHNQRGKKSKSTVPSLREAQK